MLLFFGGVPLFCNAIGLFSADSVNDLRFLYK
jgi:hypothetical protein